MKIDVKETVIKTIEENDLIQKNGHVVVGLSGGPDSMCLFHLLYSLRKEYNISLSAVHLNHKFRPGEAEDDQRFVEKYCNDMDVNCYSKTIDVNRIASETGETSEEAGRTERYKAFDEEANKVLGERNINGKIVIAVAQNSNDQAETLMMRIMRGTGPDGLAGIPYKRKSESGFQIVRPLLDIDRENIEIYCDENELHPRIDHTNRETDYNRNRIRLDLLPKIAKEYNPNIQDALLRLSKTASEDKEYFYDQVHAVMDDKCEYETDSGGRLIGVKIPVTVVKSLHPSIATRLIKEILKKIGLTQGIESKHIMKSLYMAKQNKTGKTIEFPYGYYMNMEYDFLFFSKSGSIDKNEDQENKKEDKILEIDLKKLTEGEEKEFSLEAGRLVVKKTKIFTQNENINTLALDLEKTLHRSDRLVIRYRKAGDKFKPRGLNGTKKIKDVLIDEKVSRRLRDKIPLVLMDNEIIWVTGVKKTGKYTINSTCNNTKHCLLLEWKPNN